MPREVAEVAIFEGCPRPELASWWPAIELSTSFHDGPLAAPKIVATKQFHIISLADIASKHYGRGKHRL